MRQVGRRMRVIAVVGVVVAGLGACGGSSSKHTILAKAAGSAETIKNFSFSPPTLTVARGATVTVRNSDDTTHTVTADSGGFDTGPIAGGQNATFVAPQSAGSISYHCAIHTYMHGTIVIR